MGIAAEMDSLLRFWGVFRETDFSQTIPQNMRTRRRSSRRDDDNTTKHNIIMYYVVKFPSKMLGENSRARATHHSHFPRRKGREKYRKSRGRVKRLSSQRIVRTKEETRACTHGRICVRVLFLRPVPDTISENLRKQIQYSRARAEKISELHNCTNLTRCRLKHGWHFRG